MYTVSKLEDLLNWNNLLNNKKSKRPRSPNGLPLLKQGVLGSKLGWVSCWQFNKWKINSTFWEQKPSLRCCLRTFMAEFLWCYGFYEEIISITARNQRWVDYMLPSIDKLKIRNRKWVDSENRSESKKISDGIYLLEWIADVFSN